MPHDIDRTLRAGSLALAILACPLAAQVQVQFNVYQDARLEGHDNDGVEGLGLACALDGSRLVTWRRETPSGDCTTGNWIVWTRQGSTWVEEARLDATFGPVDIDGPWIVIGDSTWNIDTGRVRVFHHDGTAWTDQGDLVASDDERWDYFGSDVAIDGDVIVVGASNEGDSIRGASITNEHGSAYVYRLVQGGWVETHKIRPADLDVDQNFGRTLDVEQDRIAVASPTMGVENRIDGRGQITIFEIDGPDIDRLETIEMPSDPEGAQLGRHLDFDDRRTLAVSSIDTTTDEGLVRVLHDVDGGGSNWDVSVSFRRASEPLAPVEASSGRVLVGAPFNGAEQVDVLVHDGAQQWSHEQSLFPTAGHVGDGFGQGSAIDGSVVVVGSPWHDNAGNGGRFATFERNGTWSQVDEVHLFGADDFEAFGSSVAIGEGVMAVGMPDAVSCANGRGMVHIFERGEAGWTRTRKLFGTTGHDFDEFGASISMIGDVLVVGAPSEDTDGTDAGAVYIFTRTPGSSYWLETARFAGPSAGARLGTSVEFTGLRVIAGAPGDERAHVYELDTGTLTWNLAHVLEDPTTVGFGTSVAMKDDLALVGAPLTPGGGAASVFDVGGFASRLATLGASSGDVGFGSTVAVLGSALLVGAPGDASTPGAIETYTVSSGSVLPNERLVHASSSSGDGFGRAMATFAERVAVTSDADVSFLWDRTGEWIDVGAASDGARQPGDAFGSSVAISEFGAAVGSSRADDGATDGGVVSVYSYDYIYLVPPCDEEVESVEMGYFGASANSSAWEGYDIAADGDLAVVGAPYATLECLDWQGNPFIQSSVGATIVYERTGIDSWAQRAVLRPGVWYSGVCGGSWYGWAVDVEQDLIAVGAPEDRPDSVFERGTAYLYRRTAEGWIEEEVLRPPQEGFTSIWKFGASVDIDPIAQRVIVGAYNASTGIGAGEGAAFIYERQNGTWVLEATLMSPAPRFAAWYGYAVAIHGDHAIVGEHRDNEAASSAGAIYHYVRQNGVWVFDDKYLAPNGHAFSRLGESVAMDATTVIAGAPNQDCVGNSNCGSAYVWDITGTTLSNPQELQPTASANGWGAGKDVSVDGDILAIGSPYAFETGQALRPGAFTIYNRTGGAWVERETTYGNHGQNERFGWSVNIEGGNVWVGARDNDYLGFVDAGASYVYDLTCHPECPVDWNEDRSLDVFDIIEFLADFQVQTPESDYNGDGAWDAFDVIDFLAEFQAGC